MSKKNRKKSFAEWKERLEKNPSKKTLHYVLTDVWSLKNEEGEQLQILKEEIISTLLKNNPTKKDLSLAINYSHNPLLEKEALKKISEMTEEENDVLRYIIENFPKKREAAALKLFKQNPSIYDLYRILECDSLREEAWEKFLAQNPNSQDFCYVIKHVKALRKKIGRMLLEKGATEAELRSIMMYIAELAEEAWLKILENPIDNYLLVHIINHGEVEIIKEKVWRKLLEKGLYKRDILEICGSKRCPMSIKEQAQILFKNKKFRKG